MSPFTSYALIHMVCSKFIGCVLFGTSVVFLKKICIIIDQFFFYYRSIIIFMPTVFGGNKTDPNFNVKSKKLTRNGLLKPHKKPPR